MLLPRRSCLRLHQGAVWTSLMCAPDLRVREFHRSEFARSVPARPRTKKEANVFQARGERRRCFTQPGPLVNTRMQVCVCPRCQQKHFHPPLPLERDRRASPKVNQTPRVARDPLVEHVRADHLPRGRARAEARRCVEDIPVYAVEPPRLPHHGPRRRAAVEARLHREALPRVGVERLDHLLDAERKECHLDGVFLGVLLPSPVDVRQRAPRARDQVRVVDVLVLVHAIRVDDRVQRRNETVQEFKRVLSCGWVQRELRDGRGELDAQHRDVRQVPRFYRFSTARCLLHLYLYREGNERPKQAPVSLSSLLQNLVHHKAPLRQLQPFEAKPHDGQTEHGHKERVENDQRHISADSNA
mmetsp:Transcript_55730/g.131799  ORF Transcript_55730/g.131799 Transcript_55730/m.131799 type:complete len:357 (+) Transcript_55730:796-1866(+)